MKSERIFVDTNILVYAHDLDAGEKNLIARARTEYLWDQSVPPSLSVQVLQELYFNLRRKKLPPVDAQNIVAKYLAWNVIPNDERVLVDGMSMTERWQISFWDGLIFAAAKRAKADVVWSEDLNPGQEYDGLLVVNPFE